MRVDIVSSAHWEGDPRLNRHVDYLRRGDISARFTSMQASGRVRSAMSSISHIVKSDADVVLLPDPELYLAGSFAARFSGKRPVIDIHEDYPKAARARPWVPNWARPVVAAVARAMVALGRRAAWRVVVAAEELARPGDYLVPNIPEPGSLGMATTPDSSYVTYVGDVTAARGAQALAELGQLLPNGFDVVVIGDLRDDDARLLRNVPGVRCLGRLPHSDAWDRAGGAVAGLSLLQAAPAYVDAVATKIWEYMAAGVVPVVSDLSGQRRVVGEIDPSLVVGSPSQAADVVLDLASNAELRASLVAKGLEMVRAAWDGLRPDQRIQEAVTP